MFSVVTHVWHFLELLICSKKDISEILVAILVALKFHSEFA